jgi:hypothetical protein
VRYDSPASACDAPQSLLPHEPHIESLLARLAAGTGGPLRPASAETLDQWPPVVVSSAAERADAVAGWLSAHPDLGVDQLAVRVAVALTLSDLGLIASYLRTSTTGGLAELSRVQETLRSVRTGLDGLGGEGLAETSGS